MERRIYLLIATENKEDRSSYHSLLPIYPLLAQQCVDDYGLDTGICLDIGTGNGYVGTEIAKITCMSIYFIDNDPKAMHAAKRTVEETQIDNEVFFIEADICNKLPFEDNFADFIVSRGSFWFWQDKVKGIAEAYRVLKVGGTALIGGGLGRYIPHSMRSRLMDGRKNMLEKRKIKRPSKQDMKNMVMQAGVPSFRIIQDSPEQDKGGWIELHKYV
jgi:SAM-dependent methyltransferase